jgi:hypothetical protein
MMSNWWWYALIVVLVVVGVKTYMQRRRSQVQGRQVDQVSDTGTPRDYSREREDLRSASLSTEDRAWETASLQRERDSRPTAAAPDGGTSV